MRANIRKRFRSRRVFVELYVERWFGRAEPRALPPGRARRPNRGKYPEGGMGVAISHVRGPAVKRAGRNHTGSIANGVNPVYMARWFGHAEPRALDKTSGGRDHFGGFGY